MLQAESSRRSRPAPCPLTNALLLANRCHNIIPVYENIAAQPNKGFQCCYAQAQFPMGYYAQSAGWGMPVSATPIRTTSANIKPFFFCWSQFGSGRRRQSGPEIGAWKLDKLDSTSRIRPHELISSCPERFNSTVARSGTEHQGLHS